MKKISSTVIVLGLFACSEAPQRYVVASSDQNGANAEANSQTQTPAPASPANSMTPSPAPVANPGSNPAPAVTPAPTPTPVVMTPTPTPTPMPMPTPDPVPPPVDPKTFASELDNYRWLFPCDKDVGAEEVCDSQAGSDVMKKFAGDMTKTYEVELRFRGVVEPMMYKDGKKINDYFYEGGVGNQPDYNIYSIEVSNPKQIYYLNRQDATGHNVFIIDYKVKIPVAGGASIRLVGNGQNGREIANFKKLVVPDIAPAPQVYNGQYVQMNVVSVKEK